MDQIKFIYGDMHLNEFGMFRRIYSKRFESVQAYHEGFIKNWNRVVGEKDVVLVLGDIARDPNVMIEIFSQLKGRKWLIMGNHDAFTKTKYLTVFEKVFVGPIAIRSRIIASHEPAPVEPGMLNLHGHTHHIKLKSNQHINLCPEWWDYTPVTIKYFEKMLGKMQKPDRSFLNEWYKDIQIPSGEGRDDLVLKKDGTIDVEVSKGLVMQRKAQRALEQRAMKAAQEFLESNLDKNKKL